MKINDNFVLGAATAAYQAEGAANEGGRGPVYWDEYLHRPGSGFNGDVASDFYHRYEQDLDLAKEIGLNAIRISITWSRILPQGIGKINSEGVDFYNRLIDACLARNIEPYVTLHHFDTPLGLFKNGDWLNRDNIDHFVAFAKICFKEFGDRVKKWVTINEPWSVVAGQYIIGHFPPNIRYDVPSAVQAMHHMMLAHARCVSLYNSMELPGSIGIIHILESKYPISAKVEDKSAAMLEDTIANRFMLDACILGRYERDTMMVVQKIVRENGGEINVLERDLEEIGHAAPLNGFLGVNYYASHFLKHHSGESQIHHNGTGEKGTSIFALKGIGERVVNPNVPTTDWDWPIYPEGLHDMLIRVKKDYPMIKEIYVTENGMGYKDEIIDGRIDDTPRIDYIRAHLDAILRAMDAGVPVKGYFLWSLMDLLSWTNGFSKRYGLFYVDFTTQQRIAKKSAWWMQKVAEKKELIRPEEIRF